MDQAPEEVGAAAPHRGPLTRFLQAGTPSRSVSWRRHFPGTASVGCGPLGPQHGGICLLTLLHPEHLLPSLGGCWLGCLLGPRPGPGPGPPPGPRPQPHQEAIGLKVCAKDPTSPHSRLPSPTPAPGLTKGFSSWFPRTRPSLAATFRLPWLCSMRTPDWLKGS